MRTFCRAEVHALPFAFDRARRLHELEISRRHEARSTGGRFSRRGNKVFGIASRSKRVGGSARSARRHIEAHARNSKRVRNNLFGRVTLRNRLSSKYAHFRHCAIHWYGCYCLSSSSSIDHRRRRINTSPNQAVEEEGRVDYISKWSNGSSVPIQRAGKPRVQFCQSLDICSDKVSVLYR